MSTGWNSQQGEGKFAIQFETTHKDLYKLVEKACQNAMDEADKRKSAKSGCFENGNNHSSNRETSVSTARLIDGCGGGRMKLFVSQPMNGLSDEDILKAREAAVLAAEEKCSHVFDVIDSFFQDAPHDARPLWYLGESLKKLAEADVAVFAHGWQKSRGCKIEHEAAVAYGIEVLYE